MREFAIGCASGFLNEDDGAASIPTITPSRETSEALMKPPPSAPDLEFFSIAGLVLAACVAHAAPLLAQQASIRINECEVRDGQDTTYFPRIVPLDSMDRRDREVIRASTRASASPRAVSRNPMRVPDHRRNDTLPDFLGFRASSTASCRCRCRTLPGKTTTETTTRVRAATRARRAIVPMPPVPLLPAAAARDQRPSRDR